jgi:hypothetical protein
MKHKKMLLIIALLTLFVFQQVQAGGREISLGKNPSQINSASSNSTYLTDHVSIYLYVINANTGGFVNSAAPQPCDYSTGSTTIGQFGCGNAEPTYSPAGTSWRCNNDAAGCYWLNVEDDYLPNVVTIEMNLGSLPAVPEALRAQAVAVRSHVNWKVKNGKWDNGSGQQDWVSSPYINNSSQYAVYSPNYTNSAASTAVQDTENQFLYHISTCSDGVSKCHVIDAEFSNDLSGQNLTSDGNVFTLPGDTGNAPYLASVEDPISNSGCGRPVGIGNQIGMIQLGADRWATGNTCPDGTGANWPVNMPSPILWKYKQILAHYYTGVDFMNDDTGGKVAPDYRWNLLKYDMDANPQVTVGGDPLPIKITVQNTSAKDLNWAGDDVVVNYQWTANGATAASDGWLDFPTAVPVVANIGNPPVDVDLLVPPPPDTANGTTQTLHLDLKKKDGTRFSNGANGGWPDAQIAVTVNGGTTVTPTFTPTETPTA